MTPHRFAWTDQRAVVTGGSEGIGRALVEALVNRGAAVACCARNTAKLPADRSDTGTIAGFACDVRDEAQVAAFARDAQNAIGIPTLLVNNAGIARWSPTAEMSLEDWSAVIDTNLTGMFLVTRAFLPGMIAAGRGAIVNVASLAGRNGVAGGAAYSATKHGVLGFSKSLMLEVRRQGVRVIAVCPGSVDTPFFDKSPLVASPNRAGMLRAEDVAQAILDAVALPERAMISELDIRPSMP